MRKTVRACVLAATSLLVALAASAGHVSASPADGARAPEATDQCKRPIGTSFRDRLIPGQCLRNGAYELVMQYDGNLVLYSGPRACWSSGTGGTEGVYARYSGDFAVDSPYMSLDSPFGELRKYPGAYTGLHKTGDVSLNNRGEVWVAYRKVFGC